MFNKIKSFLISSGKNIISSIVFLPTIIATAFIALCIFLLSIEQHGYEWRAFDLIPFIEIKNSDTARSLVATTLTGTISLVIFSFTMMMFVVQQAASNYSSKVIGNILTRRSNQIILGFYIGTIIYTIILLMQIRGEDTFGKVPHLTLLTGVVLFIVCFLLFIKFINDIYTSVQIYNVIHRIYKQTRKSLKAYDFSKDVSINKNSFTWYEYKANKSGYFQDTSNEILLSKAKEHDLVIRIIPPKGFYQVKGVPLYALNKEIKDPKILADLEDGFLFYTGEKISDNAFFGIRQLSEVAVLSLSTGINAPGTAIACLDYLGDLLITRMEYGQNEVVMGHSDKTRVIIPEISFSEICEICISPVRIYGRKDVNLVISLLNLFYRLSLNDPYFKYRDVLNRHAQAVIEDGNDNLSNALDRESLGKAVIRMKEKSPLYFETLN